MKPRSKSGLKLKIWEYFCIFTVVMLVIIWILQVAFIQYFYVGAMAKENLKNARELTDMLKHGTLNEKIVNDKAFDNNFTVIIADEFGNIISANDAMGVIGENRIEMLNEYAQAIGDVNGAIEKKERKEVYYHLERDGVQNSVLFYAAKAKNIETSELSYIYVISLLEPIDSVVSVMQGQFILISFIALIGTAIIAYIIARRFSRPIEKLTQSAREMALGNQTIDFEAEEKFAEISELSHALSYANEEIKKSAEYRRELMANVSHDLRTPLTMIKMYAEMIRDISGDNKEKREKNLKIIIDETDRLSLLVNDILELSKIEGGKDKFEIRVFDISQTVAQILELFSVMAKDGYTFELEAPEHLYVLGDKPRIEQVIYNLLGNAINYTGEDKRVCVKITKKFDCARIEIIDTGEGIKKEDLANIWDRYYRSKTHIRSKIGTGLGLSIVKSILVMHNSDFGINSVVGSGSNFWFELKLPENSANKVLRLADNNTVSDD